MMNFIVLGIVPFTHSRLSFYGFVTGIAIITLVAMMLQFIYRHVLQKQARLFIIHLLSIRKISRKMIQALA